MGPSIIMRANLQSWWAQKRSSAVKGPTIEMGKSPQNTARAEISEHSTAAASTQKHKSTS